MIYITGDTHNQKDWEKVFDLYTSENLTEDDYIIITGDFGAIWYGTEEDAKTLDRYKGLKCTILFVDGNHENFDALYKYPVENWKGGKIHKVAENIFHLMRGQVFTIEGKTFFTLGGGTSIDKEYRLYYEEVYKCKVWWNQENPTEEELEMATKNLAKHNNKVDYIITHTISKEFMLNTLKFLKEDSRLCRYLDYVLNNVEYKRWFCGHFHVDRGYDEHGVSILYNSVFPIK